MKTHKVVRPFEGHVLDEDGNKQPYQYKAGELVDVSDWRNVEGLIQGRYLMVLPVADVAVTAVSDRPKGNRIQQAAQVAREA